MRMACLAGINKPLLVTVFAVIAIACLSALADADFEESFGPVPFGF